MFSITFQVELSVFFTVINYTSKKPYQRQMKQKMQFVIIALHTKTMLSLNLQNKISTFFAE